MHDPTEVALRAAILEHPSDLATRLVYADWCEENGRDELAAVVRGAAVPTAGQFWDWYASYPGSWLRAWPGSPAVRVVQQGEAVAECTVGYFSPGAHKGEWRFALWHGFVRAVYWPLRDWLHYGPGLLARQPIEQVIPSGVEPHSRTHRERTRWRWWNEEIIPTAHPNVGALPAALWLLLRGGDLYDYSAGRVYETADVAWEDLSQACLALARQEAKAC